MCHGVSPDVGLRLANKFIQDFRTTDDLGFTSMKHFPNLPGHQCLPSACRKEEEGGKKGEVEEGGVRGRRGGGGGGGGGGD